MWSCDDPLGESALALTGPITNNYYVMWPSDYRHRILLYPVDLWVLDSLSPCSVSTLRTQLRCLWIIRTWTIFERNSFYQIARLGGWITFPTLISRSATILVNKPLSPTFCHDEQTTCLRRKSQKSQSFSYPNLYSPMNPLW
jgi:hypothetical protein